MNAFELSLFLNELDVEDTESFKAAERWAKESGLVIATASEFNCLRLAGAIDAYARFFDDSVLVTKDSVYDLFNVEDAPSGAAEIRMRRCFDESVELSASIPFDSFNVRDDGILVCTGCVFSVDSLKAA